MIVIESYLSVAPDKKERLAELPARRCIEKGKKTERSKIAHV
jgi:hypothetical protein